MKESFPGTWTVVLGVWQESLILLFLKRILRILPGSGWEFIKMKVLKSNSELSINWFLPKSHYHSLSSPPPHPLSRLGFIHQNRSHRAQTGSYLRSFWPLGALTGVSVLWSYSFLPLVCVPRLTSVTQWQVTPSTMILSGIRETWLDGLVVHSSPSCPPSIRLAGLSEKFFQMSTACPPFACSTPKMSLCDSLGNCSQGSVTQLRAMSEARTGSAVKPGVGLGWGWCSESQILGATGWGG